MSDNNSQGSVQEKRRRASLETFRSALEDSTEPHPIERIALSTFNQFTSPKQGAHQDDGEKSMKSHHSKHSTLRKHLNKSKANRNLETRSTMDSIKVGGFSNASGEIFEKETDKEALIQGLISPDGFGETTVKTLILTISRFMRSHQLLKILFDAYYANESVGMETKVRIMAILATWVSLQPEDFTSNINNLVIFSNWHAILNDSGNEKEKRWAEDFMHVLIRDWNKHIVIHLDVNNDEIHKIFRLKPQESVIFKVSEKYLAAQLTILDFDLYSRIKSHELLQKNWETNTSSSLMSIRDSILKVSYLVATEIVSLSDRKARLEMLSKFIRIAGQLEAVGNLMGVWKIIKGLTLFPVLRLTKTWRELSESDQNLFIKLISIVTPSKSGQYKLHTNYMKTAATLIPSIPIITHDIETMEDSEPDISHDGFMNLKKMKKIALIVFQVRKFQRTSYDTVRDQTVLEYWRKSTPKTYEELLELSKNIESDEKPNAKDHEEQNWWFSKIDQKTSEEILSSCPYDCFLVALIFSDVHSDRRNTGWYLIQDSEIRYPSLSCLVHECPELYGYKPVSSELAKSEKKKLKLKFSEDGRYERMELVKLWYSRMHLSSLRFFRSIPTISLVNEDNMELWELVQRHEFSSVIYRVRNGLPLTTSVEKRSLWHVAAEYNLPVLLDLLVQLEVPKPDINCFDGQGWTSLQTACQIASQKGLHNHRIIEEFIRYGANVNVLNRSGCTALHYFVRCKSEHKGLVLLTLKHILEAGANLDAQDSKGQTALHLATIAGNIDVADFLIEKGANPCIPNKKKLIPYDLALHYENKEMIDLLAKADRKSNRDYVMDIPGFTIEQGNKSVKETLKSAVIDDFSMLFTNHFMNKEHYTLFGNLSDLGSVILSCGENQILLRTTTEDSRFYLAKVANSVHFRESLRTITGQDKCTCLTDLGIEFHVLMAVNDPLSKCQAEMDPHYSISENVVPILHIKDKDFPDIKSVDKVDKTPALNQFIEFLGKPTSDDTIACELDKIKILFRLGVPVPSKRESSANYNINPVIVAFVEAAAFDPSAWVSLGASVFIVIHPSQRSCRLYVCMKSNIPTYNPITPKDATFNYDTDLKKFLFSKSKCFYCETELEF